MLAPELALVAFLTHLNKDRFAYLSAFGDIARVVGHPGLDWDLVERFVAGEGLAVPVWKSLDVVARTLELDLDIPAGTDCGRLGSGCSATRGGKPDHVDSFGSQYCRPADGPRRLPRPGDASSHPSSSAICTSPS